MCILDVSVTALRISQGKTLACTCADRTSIPTFKLWTTRRMICEHFNLTCMDSAFQDLLVSSKWCLPAVKNPLLPVIALLGWVLEGQVHQVDVWASSVERLTGRFCCWLGCSPELGNLVGKLMPSSPRHTSFKWNLYFTQVGLWRQLSKHKDLNLDYQHPCEKPAMVACL